MGILNFLACCCTCNAWCSGCCGWYCLLTPCAMAYRQMRKSHGMRMIWMIILFWCCPFLCCVGCFHCFKGCPSTWDKVQKLMGEAEDVEQAYKDIIIPEPMHNDVITNCEKWLDSTFHE